MNDAEKWDRVLKQSLAADEEPEAALNQAVVNRYAEGRTRKPVYRRKISVALLTAIFTLAMGVTAFGATHLFSSKQVAEHLGESVLADAFESPDAVEINRAVVSGGYDITLQGIVSGAGLSAFKSSVPGIAPDRTYAVVSIAREDGLPMPAAADPAYGEVPFFVSPLIKGEKPWQLNIFTMHGGYGETVMDGVMYRLIECDGVEMFADRGVYLAVSSGSSFFEKDAFDYNESTGEVSPNKNYKGASVLFDLPLDKSKADPAKAEAYLRELLPEPKAGDTQAAAEAGKETADAKVPVSDEEAALARQVEEWKKKIPVGKVIPDSVKEVTSDDKGQIAYEYDGWSAKLSVDQLFAEGQTGMSDAIQVSGDGKGYKALVFFRDAGGVITGKVIELD